MGVSEGRMGARSAVGSTSNRPTAYDGSSPFARQSVPGPAGATALRIGVTVALVLVPFAGLVAAGWMLWGTALSVADVVIAGVLYAITGLGVTIGYHRGLTHGSFTSRRPLQLLLVLAGSMAFEGGVIDWVATHRRHHAFTDRPGDPHSPYRFGTTVVGQVKGAVYAHLGWLLTNDPTPADRYAPDLLRDPMIRRVQNAFPLLCIASLTFPFLLGFALTGNLRGAVITFVWAGLARVALLQHVTWSVNSLCHLIGERPYATRRFDRSTNLWPLALLSFGESWHNGHHADPSCASHGRTRWQVDPSAIVIRLFERFGWISEVHWPAALPRLVGERRTRP